MKKQVKPFIINEYDHGRFHVHEYNDGKRISVLKHNSLKPLQNLLMKGGKNK